ncbi:MAG: hypothetical protein QXY21_02145, partial [Candidatus Micrarchaeaceae archaeon]
MKKLFIIFAIIAFAMLLPYSLADNSNQQYTYKPSSNNVANVCSMQSSNTNIYSYSSTFLSISFLLVLLMASIFAIAFAVGYAFGIDNLIKFAKIELGEIIITLLIIAIFFAAVSSVNGTVSIFGNTFSQSHQGGIIGDDCISLYNISISVFAYTLVPISFPLFTFSNMLSSIEISAMPLRFGIYFMPFGGFGLILNTISYLNN